MVRLISVAEAVRILGEMEQALAQMAAHHAAAQEQPLEELVGEPRLAKVEPLGNSLGFTQARR